MQPAEDPFPIPPLRVHRNQGPLPSFHSLPSITHTQSDIKHSSDLPSCPPPFVAQQPLPCPPTSATAPQTAILGKRGRQLSSSYDESLQNQKARLAEKANPHEHGIQQQLHAQSTSTAQAIAPVPQSVGTNPQTQSILPQPQPAPDEPLHPRAISTALPGLMPNLAYNSHQPLHFAAPSGPSNVTGGAVQSGACMPRWDNYGHPQGYLHSVPADSNNPHNMMWVNNLWQNVYYEPHRQMYTTSPYNSLQLPSLRIRTPPGQPLVPVETQPMTGPPLQMDESKSYDLAKIHRLGFTVIRGRVYNQQNHPMCAAPRENGSPCRRNVSRSPCRWHGVVALLTRYNTKNGLLDDLGNIVETSGGPIIPPAPATPTNQHERNGSSGEQQGTPKVVTRSLRWNNEEHYWFLLGLEKYGHRWSIISKIVRTRNTLQVQSHAQKFFERQNKRDKKKSTIHDLRVDSMDLKEIAEKYTDEEREKRVDLKEEYDAGDEGNHNGCSEDKSSDASCSDRSGES